MIQALQSISFALFLPAAVYYVKRISPIGLSSTFLTLSVSFYFGIGGILGSFFGGIIIDKFDLYSMFYASTGIAIIGMLIFIFSTWKYNKVDYSGINN